MPGMPIGSRPMINPLNRELWHLPIDSITIERSGVAVSLSDSIRRVVILMSSLERSLVEAFTQIPEELRGRTHAADVTVKLVMEVRAHQIVPEDAPDPEPILAEETKEEPDS